MRGDLPGLGPTRVNQTPFRHFNRKLCPPNGVPPSSLKLSVGRTSPSIYRAVIGREDDSSHSVPGALSFWIGLVRSDWSEILDSLPEPTLSLRRFPNHARTLDLVFAYGHFARDI